MSIEGKVVDAAPGQPDDPQALQEEIERTREHLGQTVEALMAKVDVKARAQDEASRLIGRLKASAVQARQQAAARAAQARRQAADKTAGPRQQATAQGLARPTSGRRASRPRPRPPASRRRPSAARSPSRSSRVAAGHLEGHARAGQAGRGQRRRHRPAAAHAAARGDRRDRRGPGRVAAVPAVEAARVKLLNKAIGLLVGILGGMLARSVVQEDLAGRHRGGRGAQGDRRAPRLAGDPARGGASGRHLRRRAGRPRPRHGRGHRQAHRRVARRGRRRSGGRADRTRAADGRLTSASNQGLAEDATAGIGGLWSNGPFERTILNFRFSAEDRRGGEIGNGRISFAGENGAGAGRRIGDRGPGRRAAVKRCADGGFLSEVTGKHVR